MAITSAYETPIEGLALTAITDPSVIPAGDDRGLLALTAFMDAQVDAVIDSVVFNTSEALALGDDGTNQAVADQPSPGTRTRVCAIHELEAPSAADAALVATIDQEVNTAVLIGVLLNGVHQSDMIGGVASAIGESTQASVDIVTTEADSLIVVLCASFSAALTMAALADTTQKVNDNHGSGSALVNYFAGERSEATPDTYTVGATVSGGGGLWACVAVEILNAAVGGGDPEGPLVGGKLVGGGLLMKGRLVG